MAKLKWNGEMLVAGAAMLTAIAAVVVAIIQTLIMREEAVMEREHARLSVKPALAVVGSRNDDPDNPLYSIELSNQGLGPAVIEQFSVFYDGRYLNSWDELVESVSDGKYSIAGENENINGWSISGITPGTILPAGRRLLSFQVNENIDLTTSLKEASENLEVIICFCSVYQECWETRGVNRPRPVKFCRLNAETFFNGVAK